MAGVIDSSLSSTLQQGCLWYLREKDKLCSCYHGNIAHLRIEHRLFHKSILTPVHVAGAGGVSLSSTLQQGCPSYFREEDKLYSAASVKYAPDASPQLYGCRSWRWQCQQHIAARLPLILQGGGQAVLCCQCEVCS